MLAPSFYSQLTVCEVCHGYGMESFPPENFIPCRECGGLGVFLTQIDKTFVWGLPSFIEMGRRKRIKIIKIIILTITLGLFLFLYFYFFRNLI